MVIQITSVIETDALLAKNVDYIIRGEGMVTTKYDKLFETVTLSNGTVINSRFMMSSIQTQTQLQMDT